MTQASPPMSVPPASNSSSKVKSERRKSKISYSSAPRNEMVKDLTNNPHKMEAVRRRILQKEKDKALAKLKVNLEDTAFIVKCHGSSSDIVLDLNNSNCGQEMTEDGCSSLQRSVSSESVSSTLSSTHSSALSQSSLPDNDDPSSGLSKRSTLDEALNCDGDQREGEEQISILANICSLISSAFWKPIGIPKRVPLIHENYTPLLDHDHECRHAVYSREPSASIVLPFVASPAKTRENRALSTSA